VYFAEQRAQAGVAGTVTVSQNSFYRHEEHVPSAITAFPPVQAKQVGVYVGFPVAVAGGVTLLKHAAQPVKVEQS